MGAISSLYGGLDRTAGNPARPKPHLNSYSIGVRFGVGVVAESNDQAASDAAVRAVMKGHGPRTPKRSLTFCARGRPGNGSRRIRLMAVQCPRCRFTVMGGERSTEIAYSAHSATQANCWGARERSRMRVDTFR